ncbi:MAG TPA: hypothetical protein VD905_15800 [Flavobacteriales bacterium]|nr:hypothetical protein [Flavobacteriales bacterium]
MSVRISIAIVMAVFLLSATRCSSEGEDGGTTDNGKLKLTGQWTNGMSVSYYSGGGMLNEYTRYEIYTDSASYTMHRNQATNKYRLKFTKAELDAIAKIFYDNAFPLLRPTKHEVIYDKGTRSITLCSGGECLAKGDDATSSYTGRDGEKLNTIQNEVSAIVAKKMGELPKSTVELVFEQTLIKTKYDYYVQFEPSPVQYNSKNDGKLNETTVDLPAGSYNVNVYTYRTLPNGGTKYGGSAYATVNTNEFNRLTIGMAKDSSITIKPSRK